MKVERYVKFGNGKILKVDGVDVRLEYYFSKNEIRNVTFHKNIIFVWNMSISPFTLGTSLDKGYLIMKEMVLLDFVNYIV